MGIVPKFRMPDMDAVLKQAEAEWREQMIRILRFVGEKAVNEAKANGNYQDRTANLRNSIGYMIAIDGVAVSEDFSTTARGTEPSKEDPVKYGRNLAREVIKGQKGISLVVVSGMRYGAYVESGGRNVLTSAEQLAKRELERIMRELGN